MDAVQAGDANRLRKLSSPLFSPADVDAAISRRIAKIGSRHWIDPQVRWTEGITPNDAQATITASDDASHGVVDIVYLAVIKDRWCVSLGSGNEEGTIGFPRPS